VGALGHYLEAAGIATTGISLVREHTEIIQPPRALWVTFELGRPLGAPDDAALQRRVLKAALALLEATSGPVLEDYPETIAAADLTGWACPVNFASTAAANDDIDSALQREIGGLAPWYDRAVRHAGRTTVGVSGLSMTEAARFLVGFLDGGSPPSAPAGMRRADAVKRACEDLKAYYLEALHAQPGGGASARQQADWLWGETALGRLFLDLHPIFNASDDPALRWIGIRLLVPATQAHRLAGSKPLATR
jgi:hypothetical protein